METVTEADIANALRQRGVEIMDDPRPIFEIGRQFGIVAVATEVEITPLPADEGAL